MMKRTLDARMRFQTTLVRAYGEIHGEYVNYQFPESIVDRAAIDAAFDRVRADLYEILTRTTVNLDCDKFCAAYGDR